MKDSCENFQVVLDEKAKRASWICKKYGTCVMGNCSKWGSPENLDYAFLHKQLKGIYYNGKPLAKAMIDGDI